MVDKSFQGLVLSLIIHGILLWWLISHPMPSITPPEKPTEITLIEKDKVRLQQLIPKLDDKETDTKEELKDAIHQVSEVTKRVKEQMQARKEGQTVNRPLSLTPTLPPFRSDKPGKQEKEKLRGEEPGLRNPIGSNGITAVDFGGESTGQYMPGLKRGAFNAFNTDRVTYGAFFGRVDEQMGNRWRPLIRSYAASLPFEELKRVARKDRTTAVEIFLNRTGEYVKHVLHMSSGISPLDHAAIDAFKMAAPFLNPPKELVEADGYIHLRYIFVVYGDPNL